MQEAQDDERNAQGVQEHQHRDGRQNDSLETKLADQERDDRKDDHPGAVLHAALGKVHKVRGRAADKADGRGKARKEHHDRQKRGAGVAEEHLGAQSQDRGARFLHADHAHAFGADLGDEDVDKAEHGSGDHGGLQNHLGDVALLGKTRVAHDADREGRKDQRGNGVKRVVAVQNALHHGLDRGAVGLGRRLRNAHGRDQALDDENNERENEKGRENLAHAVNELARASGKPAGKAEEHREEHGHVGRGHRRIDKGHHSDFPGHGAGTGSGKARADRENADGRVERAEPGVHAVADLAQIGQTRVTHGDHGH